MRQNKNGLECKTRKMLGPKSHEFGRELGRFMQFTVRCMRVLDQAESAHSFTDAARGKAL